MKSKYFSFTLLLVTLLIVFSCSRYDDNTNPIDCTKIINECEIEITDLDFETIPWAIFFVNENNGFIGGNNGTIIRVENKGVSSTKLNTETVSHIRSLYFLNEKIGFASGTKYGESAIFLTTNNGGNTWTKRYFKDTSSIENLHFFNENEGLSIIKMGSEKGIIHKLAKTYDKGESWDFVDISLSVLGKPISYTSNKIYVTGNNRVVYSSSDKGETWTSYETPVCFDREISNINFLNDSVGFIDSWDSIFKTVDGGESWIKIATDFRKMGRVHFFNQDEGFVLDDIWEYEGGDFPQYQGTNVYQTIDGGINWSKSQLYPNCLRGGVFTFNSKKKCYIVSYNQLSILTKL